MALFAPCTVHRTARNSFVIIAYLMSTSIETPIEAISQARAFLAHAYRRRDSWQAVADYYGRFSKAAYWRLVNEPGYRPPTELVEHVLDKGIPPRLVSIPIDFETDAEVYYVPGHGRVNPHIVPADAGVVIVPAGARIVQPKPQSSKPRRRRWRIDLTEYAGRVTADEVREMVRERVQKQ